jgi:hypothetical protein
MTSPDAPATVPPESVERHTQRVCHELCEFLLNEPVGIDRDVAKTLAAGMKRALMERCSLRHALHLDREKPNNTHKISTQSGLRLGNKILKETADRFYTSGSNFERAERLCSDLDSYKEKYWEHHGLDVCPAPEGTLEAAWWWILYTRGGRVLKVTAVRQIIGQRAQGFS